MSSCCETIWVDDFRDAPAGTASAPATTATMTSLRSTTLRQGSCRLHRYQEPVSHPTQARVERLVPGTAEQSEDADVAVQRVALHRRLAQRPDQVHELLGRRAIRRSGCGDDIFLDHHRAEVVCPELQRHLPDLLSLRHP